MQDHEAIIQGPKCFSLSVLPFLVCSFFTCDFLAQGHKIADSASCIIPTFQTSRRKKRRKHNIRHVTPSNSFKAIKRIMEWFFPHNSSPYISSTRMSSLNKVGGNRNFLEAHITILNKIKVLLLTMKGTTVTG